MNSKILIVDDEAHIRSLLEQTLEDLEDEGVELLFAENGVEALKQIQQELPQLVFLDVMMPQMSGFEVCQQLKHDADFQGVFLVLLTAKGQEADWKKGQEVGADLFLTKPFDPEYILKKAREILHLE